MSVHTEDKPFKCQTCDKAFSNADALKKHMRVHMGQKPYKCHMCDRAFSESRATKRHMMTVHAEESAADMNPVHHRKTVN